MCINSPIYLVCSLGSAGLRPHNSADSVESRPFIGSRPLSSGTGSRPLTSATHRVNATSPGQRHSPVPLAGSAPSQLPPSPPTPGRVSATPSPRPKLHSEQSAHRHEMALTSLPPSYPPYSLHRSRSVARVSHFSHLITDALRGAQFSILYSTQHYSRWRREGTHMKSP